MSQHMSVLGLEEATSVGTPPRRKHGMMDLDLDGMSWEHIQAERRYNSNPPTVPIMENGETRAVKAVPKALKASVPNATATPTPKKTRPHGFSNDVPPTSTKRKARDMDFDSDLSSATPSADEKASGKKKRDVINNLSFETSSSNSTVKGRSRRVSVDDVVGGKLRQSNGGMTSPVTRMSTRSRDRQVGTPGNTRRATAPQTERRRTSGRYRAPSTSSSGEDDEPTSGRAGPSTTTRRTSAAPVAAPTPAAVIRRSNRNGSTKIARLR